MPIEASSRQRCESCALMFACLRWGQTQPALRKSGVDQGVSPPDARRAVLLQEVNQTGSAVATNEC